jgi:hypothetical protein
VFVSYRGVILSKECRVCRVMHVACMFVLVVIDAFGKNLNECINS